MNLGDFREDYRRGALDRAGLDANPIAQFESWFRDATGEQSQSRWRKIGIALYKLWSAICNHRPADINAMTLATVDQSGKPSTRTVLLKSVDERGFIFFTNYDSRKGRELAENPNAALTFFWSDLERQVCVAGTVTKLPVAESEAYFKSRPRGSRLAAWASNQSDAVPDRAALEAKWRELEKKFPETFRCRRTGADLFCGRSGLNSGRAGRAGCTTGFPTRGSRTIHGSWNGSRREI